MASSRSGKRRAEGYNAPVPVHDARPDDGDVGPGLFEEGAQSGHAAGLHHHVGIADEQVGAVAHGRPQVGRRPVAEVGTRRGPFDLGVDGPTGRPRNRPWSRCRPL